MPDLLLIKFTSKKSNIISQPYLVSIKNPGVIPGFFMDINHVITYSYFEVYYALHCKQNK